MIICVIYVLCLSGFRGIDALWSTAGKELTALLSFVKFNCVFVNFPCGILGQMWLYLFLIFAAFLILYRPHDHALSSYAIVSVSENEKWLVAILLYV